MDLPRNRISAYLPPSRFLILAPKPGKTLACLLLLRPSLPPACWPLYTPTIEVPDSAMRKFLLPDWKPRSLIQPFCTNSLMRIIRRAHRRAIPLVCKILSTATRCSAVPSNLLGSWLKRPKWTVSSVESAGLKFFVPPSLLRIRLLVVSLQNQV
jgi:hypothetical protein